jgi:hypothetical protein
MDRKGRCTTEWKEKQTDYKKFKSYRKGIVKKKNNRNKAKGSGEGRNIENLASNSVDISKDQETKPSYRISFEGGLPLSSNM